MSDPVGPDTFRTLLGSFATGVTVVTAAGPDGAVAGMTASSVASTSLDPPLLLVCVGEETDFIATVRDASAFALSVLAADQEAIARRFAAKHPARFEGVPTTRAANGLPLIDGAAAHILCDVWTRHVAGDHTVFFGLVTGGEAFPRPPLLHFRGAYRTLGA